MNLILVSNRTALLDKAQLVSIHLPAFLSNVEHIAGLGHIAITRKLDLVRIIAIAHIPEHSEVLAFKGMGEIIARGGFLILVVGTAIGAGLQQITPRIGQQDSALASSS